MITVSRALSAGIETTTKSGRVRRVPLPAQASAALLRLCRRPDFIAATELVFADPTLGRALHPVTVRRRYKEARDAVGARPLRFHEYADVVVMPMLGRSAAQTGLIAA